MFPACADLKRGVMTMAEYIEREAVVMELNKTYDNMNAMGAQFYCGFMNAVHRIKDFPAADVAPVRHGKWRYYHKQNIAVCTECSFERNLDANFGRAVSCPNCGAKMDG